MDPTSAPIVPGYRLSAVLGRGATSTVWAGERLRDGAPVAVKAVRVGGLSSGGLSSGAVMSGAVSSEAVERELAVLTSVRDDHLVRVEEVLAGSSDLVYLVMERLDGGTLSGLVQARGGLSAGEIVTALAPVAAALGALHRLGLVHGDLSPGNVFLDGSGRPVVGDFGLSGVVGEVRAELWGTAGFVAPEVLMGGAPDARSDVYAVGALGWFAATGEPPLTGCDLRGQAESLRLPSTLADVLLSLLAPEPGDRPIASEAALQIFDAVPAEPLRLADTGGDLSLLTRRLRIDATTPPAGRASGQGRPGRVRRLLRARRPHPAVQSRQPGRTAGEQRPAAAERPERSAAPARHRRVPRGARGRAALTAIGVVVAVALGLTAIGLGWRAPRSADAATRRASEVVAQKPLAQAASGGSPASTPAGPNPSGPSRAPGSSPSHPSSTSSATSSASPAAAPSAASPTTGSSPTIPVLTDPIAVVQTLADARARILTTSTANLDWLDVAGSPAAQGDAALLKTLRDGGSRYVGLAFMVRSATVTSASGVKVTVRAAIDTGAYAVTAGGAVEQRAASPGIPVLLDLQWTADGWRIYEVRGT